MAAHALQETTTAVVVLDNSNVVIVLQLGAYSGIII
jgi:hypothetical protein